MAKGTPKKQTKQPLSIKDIAPIMWVWIVVTSIICLFLLPNATSILSHGVSDPIYIYQAFMYFAIIAINILPICFIFARYQRKSVAWFCLIRGLYLGYVSLSLFGKPDILGANQTGGMIGLCITALDLYASYYLFTSEKAKNYFIEQTKKKKAK